MDLNNIDLPAFIIADLYTDIIVYPPDITGDKQYVDDDTDKNAGSPSGVNSDLAFKFLGGNKKNILIVVHHSDAVILPDNELTFLTEILNACKLSLDDVSILNYTSNPELNYKKLISFFKSRIILFFDIDPSNLELPLKFPHFQIRPFLNISFLCSPSLKDLEDDKILKSKLWVCLKRVFNL